MEILRIGGSKLDMHSNFDGKISCIQYFKQALTLSQIHNFMKCDKAEAYKTPKCPQQFHYINGLCYYFPNIQLTFPQAEVFCLSSLNETLKEVANIKMAFNTKPKELEKLLYKASSLFGTTELWIGIDDQDGDGIWTNSLGEISNPPNITADQMLSARSNCSMIADQNEG